MSNHTDTHTLKRMNSNAKMPRCSNPTLSNLAIVHSLPLSYWLRKRMVAGAVVLTTGHSMLSPLRTIFPCRQLMSYWINWVAVLGTQNWTSTKVSIKFACTKPTSIKLHFERITTTMSLEWCLSDFAMLRQHSRPPWMIFFSHSSGNLSQSFLKTF